MPCKQEGCKQRPGQHEFCILHRPDSCFEECSICLKPIRRTKDTLDCNHSFHRRCIDSWAQRGTTCPVCRAPFMEATEEEPWINVLGETFRRELTRAVNDLNNGSRHVSINIEFNS